LGTVRNHECVCLDLFAGTGSLGIEALSRGSPKVIFVELNKKNYSSLSINLKSLGIRDKCKVFLKMHFLGSKTMIFQRLISFF
jgi:16S rRNA (guanine966-N2)-methyltransferase